MRWYWKCWISAFDFSGRARRREFWFFVLYNTIVSVVFFVLAGVIGSVNLDLALVLTITYIGAVFFPKLSVSVRRLHDLDLSGWWVLVSFVPIIGALGLLLWMVQDGTPGANSHGPDPKEPPGDGPGNGNPPVEPGPKAIIAKL